jgi:NAD(P)-dependent dehydrogenase (short-subunit alcohol dehydrogenase family)
MNNPVVLITGALSGIGRATAFEFARAGARVVASGRRQEDGDKLAAELAAKGAEALFVRADVRTDDDVGNLVERAMERFGRIDNAGKEGLGAIADVTAEAYAAIFDTNVLGTLLSLKHEFRIMQKQGKGSIVNVSSVYGHVGFAHGGSVYVASKHAVEGLTRAAALEGASLGIRVNAVAPGPIETPMLDRVTGGDKDAKAAFLGSIPQRRAGATDEVAATIAFLAGDKAAYITGEIVTIDGGFAAG